ncbi:MAG: hypothetical protein EOO07_09520, partial [Chitinophagaceae bacterium]
MTPLPRRKIYGVFPYFMMRGKLMSFSKLFIGAALIGASCLVFAGENESPSIWFKDNPDWSTAAAVSAV